MEQIKRYTWKDWLGLGAGIGMIGLMSVACIMSLDSDLKRGAANILKKDQAAIQLSELFTSHPEFKTLVQLIQSDYVVSKALAM